MKEISHKKQFGYLKNAADSGKMHHSYIFYGPSGGGKFEFAIYFAKYIQCQENLDDLCGKCKNCKINDGHFIVDSYIIDLGKEDNIKMDEIKKIKDIINHSSVSGNKKIVIINNAQNITREAREVLLKTLEEPPENSLLILVTDELKKLPKTILSRCPAIFFNRPMIKKTESDNNRLFGPSKMINFGNIDFLKELKQRDSEELGNEYRSILNDLETIMGDSVFHKMILAREVSEDKSLKEKLEKWIAVLHGIFLFKNGVSDWDEDDKAFFGSLEKKLKYDKILEALEKMLNMLNLLDTNVSKKVLFEDFVLGL